MGAGYRRTVKTCYTEDVPCISPVDPMNKARTLEVRVDMQSYSLSGSQYRL